MIPGRRAAGAAIVTLACAASAAAQDRGFAPTDPPPAAVVGPDDRDLLRPTLWPAMSLSWSRFGPGTPRALGGRGAAPVEWGDVLGTSGGPVWSGYLHFLMEDYRPRARRIGEPEIVGGPYATFGAVRFDGRSGIGFAGGRLALDHLDVLWAVTGLGLEGRFGHPLGAVHFTAAWRLGVGGAFLGSADGDWTAPGAPTPVRVGVYESRTALAVECLFRFGLSVRFPRALHVRFEVVLGGIGMERPRTADPQPAAGFDPGRAHNLVAGVAGFSLTVELGLGPIPWADGRRQAAR